MQFAGLLIGLARAFPTLFGDTYPRQPEVDALHYVFRLSLSDETDEIRGEAIADLQFTRVGLAQIAVHGHSHGGILLAFSG